MKGEFHAHNANVLIMVFYEFGFKHYKTMDGAQRRIRMTYMKAEICKIRSLQRRLQTSSLSNMANRRKDAKDLYFGLLTYDLAT